MNTSLPPCVLTIAGSDSCSGAGVQADLKTFTAQGVYGLCAITAVTAQNGRELTRSQAVEPETISAQVRVLAREFAIAAVKTGMLANDANVRAAVSAIRQQKLQNVVIDPVMVSTSGHTLLERDAVRTLLREMLPLATIVTPNRAELAVMAGAESADVISLEAAADVLLDHGAKWVLVTGGDSGGPEAVDELFGANARHTFRAKRVPGPRAHGTGCTLSAAIAAQIAKGAGVPDAVEAAKKYVSLTIERGYDLGDAVRLLNHTP